MIAVLFEAEANDAQAYFRIAAELRPLLEQIDGFISIERFESLSTPGKVLSLSFWRDEEAIARWRALPPHRNAQAQGRAHIFKQYRLRIAMVTRDYGMRERAQAPPDSRAVHD